MNRDLSEVFVEEHKQENIEDDLMLPIEDSAIFRFDDKTGNFDFDSEKIKAEEIILSKIKLEDFYQDLNQIKSILDKSSPSSGSRAWILFLAFFLLSLVTITFLIIWVILILDLVVLAGEVYLLRKLKKIVWSWKNAKLDKEWIEALDCVLNELNSRYRDKGMIWKFDKEAKWIQLNTFK
jgi:hypothetical protein